MQEIKEYTYILLLWVLGIVLCLGIIVILYYNTSKALLSLLGGTILSIFNFILLAREINQFGETHTTKPLLRGYFLRYIILALGLILLIGHWKMPILPVIIGLFVIQIAIYLQNIFSNIK